MAIKSSNLIICFLPDDDYDGWCPLTMIMVKGFTPLWTAAAAANQCWETAGPTTDPPRDSGHRYDKKQTRKSPKLSEWGVVSIFWRAGEIKITYNNDELFWNFPFNQHNGIKRSCAPRTHSRKSCSSPWWEPIAPRRSILDAAICVQPCPACALARGWEPWIILEVISAQQWPRWVNNRRWWWPGGHWPSGWVGWEHDSTKFGK